MHACGGERGWLCMSIYEGWVQVVCNGYGINWGQKVWVVVAVCVCVCVHVFIFRELESSQTGFKKRRTR